ncbi:hypothetical protein [Streptomyces sp. CNQ085]|uniref:hypothetical protein n=1 Tax=Streptomyces sp. CNQ085 TaxID=2886944 RepID=UPI001F50A44C|nr:hypothetical protein [Streptomyces sp. CNQ085]MCI0385998.1 hypothetical protein [Streptomyces sp. CNQ085]
MRAAGRETGRETGLGHRDHPLLGRTVLDTATGRTGVLRAVCPEPDGGTAVCAVPVFRPGSGPPVAWLAPVGGGVEWTTEPDAIREVTG